ncbi:MAG: AAA family ATPase [Pseudomonadales bacterium]|nr:AAA family ATPase [Pseudomonadales bacterium]
MVSMAATEMSMVADKQQTVQGSRVPVYLGVDDQLNLPDKLAFLASYGEKFLIVTGKTGQGKTLLCEAVAAELQGAVPALKLEATSCDRSGWLAAINRGFGLRNSDDIGLLLAFTADLANSLKKAVLLVDDAHQIKARSLKQLLTLCEQTGLGLALFGKPSLIARIPAREFRQRIYHCPLANLDGAGARSFLRRKMPDLASVDADVLDLMIERSEGISGRLEELAEQLPAGAQRRSLPWMHFSVAAVLLAVIITGVSYKNQDTTVKNLNLLTANEPSAAGAVAVESQSEAPVTPAGNKTPTQDILAADDILAAPQRELVSPDSVTHSAEEAQLVVKDTVRPEIAETSADALQDAQPLADQPSPLTEDDSRAQVSQARKIALEVIAPRASVASKNAVQSPVSEGSKRLLRYSTRNVGAQHQDPARYTLQLMGSGTEDGIIDILDAHPNVSGLSYFRTQRADEDWYILTYDSYDSREQALAAIDQIPGDLVANRPWARTFGSINASQR